MSKFVRNMPTADDLEDYNPPWWQKWTDIRWFEWSGVGLLWVLTWTLLLSPHLRQFDPKDSAYMCAFTLATAWMLSLLFKAWYVRLTAFVVGLMLGLGGSIVVGLYVFCATGRGCI